MPDDAANHRFKFQKRREPFIGTHNGANTNNSGTGANSGPLVTSAANGPGLTNQTAFIDVAQSGTGVFTVHVVYDTTPVLTDVYQGTATAVPETPAAPPPAPQDTGPKIGYENFEAPGLLTPGTATSSGVLTVEYMGRGAGEPSIGVNWNSTSNSVGGMTNFQSDLETEFVSWDESCSPTIPKATWVNRRAPTSLLIDSDPIGFTDRQRGRVFAGELTLLSPTCKTIQLRLVSAARTIFGMKPLGALLTRKKRAIGMKRRGKGLASRPAARTKKEHLFHQKKLMG